MEVLLIKPVPGLGEAGAICKVKPGYARNYLIPRGLALPATAGLRKQATQIQAAAERRRQRELNAARSLAERIRATTLTFKARAGEGGRLYGSITPTMIAEQLSQVLGQEIDRRRLRLEQPLRELGEHEVTIHLATGVDATFKVVVEGIGEEETTAAAV
jgi:large subunit ribosomal protein L9